jgi:hypothetical protein
MTPEEREGFIADVHSMPAISFATMDPGALQRNICNRLLGPGNWTVNGVYAGNASAQQILDASVQRPHYDPIDGFRMDLLDAGIRLDEPEEDES